MHTPTLADQNLQSRIEYGTHFLAESKAISDVSIQERFSQIDESRNEILES